MCSSLRASIAGLLLVGSLVPGVAAEGGDITVVEASRVITVSGEEFAPGMVVIEDGEITLVGQPFVKDPDNSVGKMLADAGAEVLNFVRFEVGEGIEKKTENFAEEVMAQAKGG